MHSDSFNKWAGAILFAVLMLFALGVIIKETASEGLPEKPGFVVAELKEVTGAAEAPAAAAIPDPLFAVAMKAADVDTGSKLTKACQACHSFDKGGANKVGPNLWGIVGRKVASIDGFAYSEAMKGKGGNWGYEELYKFLANPKANVVGTKMGFAGYPKFEDRASLISYLRTLSDSPVPLP